MSNQQKEHQKSRNEILGVPFVVIPHVANVATGLFQTK